MKKINKPNRRGLAKYLASHTHPGGIIVSERYRFIYMKPCRTGGTSILRRTLEQLPLDTFHFKDHRQRFQAWLDGLSDVHLTRYRIFSFVRNPWDRAVSIASYFGLPFDEFLANHRELIANDRNLRHHSLPCHRYTHHAGEPFVDMIGSFESLQSDFESICSEIGIDAPRELPHANASARKGYGEYYDPKTKAQVESIYQEDIELFGYRF